MFEFFSDLFHRPSLDRHWLVLRLRTRRSNLKVGHENIRIQATAVARVGRGRARRDWISAVGREGSDDSEDRRRWVAIRIGEPQALEI